MYWNIVRDSLQEQGFDVRKVVMPRNLNVTVKVPLRDLEKFVTATAKGPVGLDEHGQLLPRGGMNAVIYPGFTLPGGNEPTIILVRKGASHVKRSICHEILHIFEYYLNLQPGTLARPFTKYWNEE